MHWLTKPGTSLPEERRIVLQGSREVRIDRRRAELRLAHRPGTARRGDRRGRLRRELDQHRSEGRLRRDPRRDRRCRRRVSRHVHERRDVPRRADQRGHQRRERADRGASARRRICKALREQGARRSRRCSNGIDGVAAVNVSLQTEVPQIQVDVDLAKARRGGRQAGRRPARRGDVHGRRGGRRHLPRRTRPTTYRCGARRSRATASTTSGTIMVDTPSGEPVRLGDVATVDGATDAELHPARGRHASPRRRRGDRRPGPRRGRATTSRPASRTIKFPLEHRAQVIGVVRRAAGRVAAPLRLRGHHGDRDLPDPGVGPQALPTGGAHVRHPAARADRVV